MTRHSQNDPMVGLNMALSRNLETNLTVLGRRWRHDHVDPQTLDPTYDAHRRDLVELLISYVYFVHRQDSEYERWPPNFIYTKEFMDIALKAREFECSDRLEGQMMSDEKFERWMTLNIPGYEQMANGVRLANTLLEDGDEKKHRTPSDEEFDAFYDDVVRSFKED